ncbi:hypothetical protein ACP70R_048531 [Stipagrostis hirtigluma subsp. patula]
MGGPFWCRMIGNAIELVCWGATDWAAASMGGVCKFSRLCVQWVLCDLGSTSSGMRLNLCERTSSATTDVLSTMKTFSIAMAIELEAHAAKGAGKVHAKWFPVATAWYRMLPEAEVVLLNEIKRNDAENLVKGEKRVAVARSRACTLCRECVQKATKDEVDQVEDEVHQVEIRLARDHFIFTVESAGSLPPEVIFIEAVKILEAKCEKVISELS